MSTYSGEMDGQRPIRRTEKERIEILGPGRTVVVRDFREVVLLP